MKKIFKLLLLTLFFCLSAAGCNNNKGKDGKDQGFYLYYINNEGNKVISEEYTPKASETIDLIEEFTDKQSEEVDSEDYQRLLPQGVSIENSMFNNGSLSLNMSKSYGEMEFTREIMARVGLVRTFGQIPGVSWIQILVAGEPLKDSQGKDIGSLSPDNFVENSGKEINTYQNISMTLYFANAEGDKLVPEERNVYYSSNVPLERVVVEQIIKGPKAEGCYPTLPSETNILSVTISDDICYVNFDESFKTAGINVAEEIPIYSIVNSLASVCKVKEVQFSINGESKVKFRENVRLDQLFLWDGSYIQE